MPTTKLLIAVILLAALSGLVYWSNKKQAQEESKPAKDAAPKLITLKDADIKQISVLKKAGEDVVLQRDPSSKWTMAKPEQWPVDQDAANSVESAFTGLSWDRLIEDKPGDLGQYGLADPKLRVSATAKDGKSQTLLIGDDSPTGSATFAKLENDPRVFAVSSFTKSSFDKSAQDLRDKRLLTFDSDKLSRVEVSGKSGSFEFGKNNQNEWQILKPGPYRADSFQVEELIRKLKDAKMDSGADQDEAKKQAAGWASTSPAAIIKVTDNSGTQQLDIRKKGDDYLAKSSVVAGVFKIAKDTGDAAAKSMDDYRNKKIFDFGFTELGRIDVGVEGKSYSFQRSGEKWQSGGKDMDNVGVQSLIDKLRDLTAQEFSKKPLGPVKDDITVKTQDGKRTETIHISKESDADYVQRENEPTVYKVLPSAINDIEAAAKDVKPAPPAGKK